MMRPEFDRLLELLPVLFPREEGFTWNRHAFLQIGYEGTPLNLDVYPYHFYAESLSSPEQHGKLDRLLSGFKKDVVLVGSRMNLTDGQVQEKSARIFWKEGMLPGKMKPPGFFFLLPLRLQKIRTFPMKRSFPLAPQNLRG